MERPQECLCRPICPRCRTWPGPTHGAGAYCRVLSTCLDRCSKRADDLFRVLVQAIAVALVEPPRSPPSPPRAHGAPRLAKSETPQETRRRFALTGSPREGASGPVQWSPLSMFVRRRLASKPLSTASSCHAQLQVLACWNRPLELILVAVAARHANAVSASWVCVDSRTRT